MNTKEDFEAAVSESRIIRPALQSCLQRYKRAQRGRPWLTLALVQGDVVGTMKVDNAKGGCGIRLARRG